MTLLYQIHITDIFGTTEITKNTPIIFVKNVPKMYLTHIINNIYDVNIDKLHNDIEKSLSFIIYFIPVSQIVLNNDKNRCDLILANTKIIQTSNNFKHIGKNRWIGGFNTGLDNNFKSLGTYYGEPKYYVPVFSSIYIVPLNNNNIEYTYISSVKEYGHFMLDKYKFNLDKTKIKMIDSMGNINVYHTSNNVIKLDTNCIYEEDNYGKITQNECNATEKKLFLLENPNPWYKNIEETHKNDEIYDILDEEDNNINNKIICIVGISIIVLLLYKNIT
uniref:Uncharacterized protein n=1 Tax=viral metagenome TaxID=1070528 RepID=A0A6C0BEW2_9ZZZZ